MRVSNNDLRYFFIQIQTYSRFSSPLFLFFYPFVFVFNVFTQLGELIDELFIDFVHLVKVVLNAKTTGLSLFF